MATLGDDESRAASSLDVGIRVEAQSNQIRDAAKWLVASFAAVGAALIAGSQLSSIGKLPICRPDSVECARLWIAAAGGTAALGGVMAAIWVGVLLLAPERRQVSDFKRDWQEGDPAFEYFEANPDQLQGFNDFVDLETKQAAAYKSFDDLAAQARADQDEIDQDLQADIDGAYESLLDVLKRRDDVVTIGNFVTYVHFFRRRALPRMMTAAVISAAGIIAFSWAANPPAPSPLVSIRGADLAGSDLSGVDLRNVDLTGAILDEADLTGADLEGAILYDASLTDVIWSGTTCPDGTSSDDAAGSCENHL